MAAMQKVPQSSVGLSPTASNYSSCMSAGDAGVSDQFPAGLRVLVVDDDLICLRIMEQMLRRCLYHVTTCSQATVALNLLRERKGCFDVILSDVHMPDMDGFILLERVGLEMDLPVIMVSGDGSTTAVMKGIRHGACDYLIKPVRQEELKNIWQHVVRRKWNGNKELEHSVCLEDNDRHKHGTDDADSSINEEAEGIMKSQKKRSTSKEEDDGELENDDPSASKKPRVVWSVELHQQFVSAVNQLGIDKAVPKRILELMNVPGLTRENVASHLQKFRLYLKRLSGVAQQHGGVSKSFSGPVESNLNLSSLGRFDIQALAASGHIPPQTLAALHAELFGHPTSNLLLPVLDQRPLLQVSLQGSKCVPFEHGVTFGEPVVKCQSNNYKHSPQAVVSVENVSSYGAWPSNNLVSVGPCNNLRGVNAQHNNTVMDILQQKKQPQQQGEHQKQQQQTHQAVLSEPSRPINVQPSCLVVPSQTSTTFQAGFGPSVNQCCNFNRSSITNDLASPQSNTSTLHVGQGPDGDIKSTAVLSGYQSPGSISQSVSSCSVNAVHNSSQKIPNTMVTFNAAGQMPGFVSNNGDIQIPHGTKLGEARDPIMLRNLGFVGKGTSIPRRFAIDELESPSSNLNHEKFFAENIGSRVKQEPNLDFMGNAKVSVPILQQFSPNDLMSVFTE